MSLPFSGSGNVGGFNIAPSEISLATSLASAAVTTSSVFNIGASGTLVVLATLASGQVSVRAKTGATSSIDMSSGGQTVTIVGAGSTGGVKVTNDGTQLYGCVRITDSNWSSGLSAIDIMVLYGRKVGRQFFWFSPDSMENGGPLNSSPSRTN